MLPKKGTRKFNGKKYYLAVTYKHKQIALRSYKNKNIWYRRIIKHNGAWCVYVRPVNPFHAQKLGLGK